MSSPATTTLKMPAGTAHPASFYGAGWPVVYAAGEWPPSFATSSHRWREEDPRTTLAVCT